MTGDAAPLSDTSRNSHPAAGSPGGYFFIEKQALYVKNMSYYYPWGRNGEHVKLGKQVPHFSRGRADPGAK